jgi:hypothetical protein
MLAWDIGVLGPCGDQKDLQYLKKLKLLSFGVGSNFLECWFLGLRVF